MAAQVAPVAEDTAVAPPAGNGGTSPIGQPAEASAGVGSSGSTCPMAPSSDGEDSTSKAESPIVRARLCARAGSAILSGGPVCVEGLSCAESFQLGLSGGRITLNGKAIDGDTILFSGKEPIRVECRGRKKTVRGAVRAGLWKNRILLVNHVAMEDYLLSVVPAESIAAWPIDALKAQAVVARTYAWYQMLHRKDWDFDVVDHAGDQAYAGVEKEHERSTRAVRETEGLVLVDGERPILAMYTANSGGHTAESEAVFDVKKAYLRAREDPASLEAKNSRWSRTFTTAEIEKAFKKELGLGIPGLKAIRPAETGPSGRIVMVEVVWNGGRKEMRTRSTLLAALGLPEILMKIEKKENDFRFEGRGRGHGVGYSQWGGAKMAKEKDFRDILNFYYPATQLEKRW